jgi:hypothetical protein
MLDSSHHIKDYFIVHTKWLMIRKQESLNCKSGETQKRTRVLLFATIMGGDPFFINPLPGITLMVV